MRSKPWSSGAAVRMSSSSTRALLMRSQSGCPSSTMTRGALSSSLSKKPALLEQRQADVQTHLVTITTNALVMEKSLPRSACCVASLMISSMKSKVVICAGDRVPGMPHWHGSRGHLNPAGPATPPAPPIPSAPSRHAAPSRRDAGIRDPASVPSRLRAASLSLSPLAQAAMAPRNGDVTPERRIAKRCGNRPLQRTNRSNARPNGRPDRV